MERQKRIKKVNGSPLSFAKNLPGKTPLQLQDFSINFKKDDSRSDDRQSFALPPAAIDPKEVPSSSKNNQYNSLNNDSIVTNDQTPLLASKRGSQSQASLNPHPSLYNRQSLINNIDEGAPLRRAMTTKSTKSSSREDNQKVENVVPLESNMSTGKKEFIDWLDSELEKIEVFYREKEEQAVERFLLLQDQLYQLKEQKENLKYKRGHEHSEELLHLKMDEAKRKLRKINKYELPSLPKFPFKKKKKVKSDDDDSYYDDQHSRRDYVPRDKHRVPYYVAKRQIKSAVQEYYRGLELLKSYRMLNRTGFRKLVKKFDKQTHSELSNWYIEKVNSNYFGTSDVLDNMIPKVEELFSLYFENGNRKVAVEKLRSNLREDQFYTSMFLSGILFGISIPLLIYALYFGLHKTLTHEMPEGKFVLQIWGGFFLIVFMAALFAINCYVWTKYKINYKFIFEFNPKTALDFRQYSFIPSLILFFLAIFMWFSFNDFWPERLPESRKWLIITMWRLVLSGFYPVEFKDFSLGDIFCSLTYTMGNISFFFCMYGTGWSGALQGSDSPSCGSSKSKLMGFFATLPPIWRFLQCLRRYADSGDWFPHLANMAKYGVTIIYYMLLSIYRIDSSVQNRAVFILFAIINSLFSGFWDILMDWSLFQNKKLLRNDLTFPKWFYYFAIVSDIILRFQWIFYALFSRQIQQSAVTSFCIAIAEVFRRFIWLLIRMENEHVTNKHLYRASREVSLPYDVVKRVKPDQQRSDDLESRVGYDSIGQQQEQPDTTPASMRRRRDTLLNSGVLRDVGLAIVNAHAKDFQRRSTKPGEIPEDNNSSDDDDNSDAESSFRP
ncbi:putative membrane protein [Wickerhamomyces ciferrii]|uniref:Membrane protein n=1 Tax=Wickerhamomyces ciferrii (strain ATCC 14091 / BCRC 22168 / CBS 111 / JCM 3599 / NBRC 0793 / NRRL Y-1031 F-60-10) TaxID=1206466 RepID=K0KK95_WICCF|nr:uncharacterized protein BN7_1423 [Wickerhamomyces ciferrii]CCH41884.1 putative membrane protein [Wickerhamomyces ciferrii]